MHNRQHSLWYIMITLSICLITRALPANDLDSLKAQLNNTTADSLRMELLYNISLEASRSNPVEAMQYAQKYLDLAIQLGIKKEIVSANNHIGILYYSLGDLSKTIDYFKRSSELLNDKEDARTKASLLNNLAIVYDEMQQFDKAIEYYRASLEQKISLGMEGTNLSSTYSNLGLSYISNKQYDLAREYIWKGYEIDLGLKDSANLASTLENIGIYYSSLNNYDSAIHYLEISKTMAIDLGGEEYLLSDIYSRLGKIYARFGNYDKAQDNFELALKLANSLELSNIVIESYLGLAEISKAKGDYKNALNYYQAYTTNKDSVFTEDAKNKLEGVETSFQVERKEQEIQLLTQKNEIDQLNLTRHRLIQYILIGSVLILIYIAILFYSRNKFKVKALKMLHEQKDKIDAKNKEILDSIHYAKGIQEAMLPSSIEFKQLFDHGFIFYKATDMVTGDFYWASQTNDGIILAVVDCTGHGVPGALLTVLANSIITDLVKEKGITSPAEILGGLHKVMLERLHQDNSEAIYNNGLDAAICLIPKNSNTIIYAGAKRPLYYIHDNSLQVVKGNYFSVGTPHYNTNIDYDNHEISMNKGDLIYLFTDGLIDQFGGDNGKKFLGKRLRELLMNVHQDNAEDQKNKIKSTIDDWMGREPQVDDMLLVGVKI